MKNKKMLLLLICVLIAILLSIFFVIKHFNTKTTNEELDFSEYTPEEEISTEQMRETVVALYFPDLDSNLKVEARFIDSLSLLSNPYKTLVELLLETPQSEDLTSAFPDNTKILNTSIENGCVILNFSTELVNYTDDTQKYNIINSLLNTLTQLNEVNSIKILVDNNTSENFNEEYTLLH